MFSSEAWLANPSSGFFNNVATQSARFNSGSSSYLYFTPSSNGDRRKATLSFWFKKTGIGETYPTMFCCNNSQSGHFMTITFYEDSLYFQTAPSADGLITTAKYRDTTAWYHCCWSIDTTQSTASDRVKCYINGSQITSFSTEQYPDQDSYLDICSTVQQAWGYFPGYGRYFNGYIADAYIIDGQQLTPSSFTETKNGALIPKKYTGSYGTNGVHLEFKQTGTGTASTSTIGADTSGNTHHYTSAGMDSHDSNLPDSPENNFATLLKLRSGENASSQTLSEGNLQWTSSAYGYNSTGSSMNIPTSGKWYWEVYIKTAGSATSHDIGLGIQGVKLDSMSKTDPATATYGDSTVYITRNDFGSRIEKNLGNVYIGTSGSASTVNYVADDIISVAFDADSGKVFWGKNNVFWDDDVTTDGNPSAGTNETTSLTTGVEYFFTLQQYSNVYVSVSNFGQDSSFAGNKTAQGNKDANDIGDFYYAVPTGYQALCSANLSEPTISPNANTQADDHFDTLLYTGNNQSAQDIGGLGFKPDWVIIKGRSYTDWGMHFDSSRGTGKTLQAFRTYAEGDYANTLDEFRSDGFGLGADSTAQVNYQTNTYVAWCWKANGSSASASGTESGNTLAYSTQVNSTAGFAIVTYTGNGADDTDCIVNHALGSTPAMVIVKNRTDGSSRYQVYHQKLTSGKNILLDSTNGEDTYTSYIKAVSSSTFTVRDSDADGNLFVNKDNSNYVAYVFAEVEGFSKFGSYVGNGSSDGTYCHLGFKPAMIFFTNITSAGYNWIIFDNKTATVNVRNKYRGLDLAQSEQTFSVMDFLSNGFKLRTSDAYFNANNSSYIYMAFAENPFKYSTAE